MRCVIQRVLNASCTVDNKLISKIDKGYMILVGLEINDTIEEVKLLAKKTIGLRIFSDANDKMNLSINDVKGSILAISQFTLYADSKHGNRPSFTNAMKYDLANDLYNKYCDIIENSGIEVKRGVFGADMKIELINDGPVTIILDTKEL